MCRLKDSLIKKSEKSGKPLNIDKREICVDIELENIMNDKIKEDNWDIEASEEEINNYNK